MIDQLGYGVRHIVVTMIGVICDYVAERDDVGWLQPFFWSVYDAIQSLDVHEEHVHKDHILYLWKRVIKETQYIIDKIEKK